MLSERGKYLSRRLTVWQLGVALIVLLLAVFGSTARGATRATSAPAPISLNVVTPGTGVVFSDAALAQALGYFKQVGLNVHMDAVASSSLINSLVSGSADVGAASISGALIATQKGQYMTMLYGYQGNHQVGSFIGRPGITSLAQLKKMPSCKIATTTVGTSYYGYASHYLKSLGLHCSLTQFSDTNIAIGSIVAGSFDAGAFSYGDVIDLVKQKKVNLLIDTSKPAVGIKYNGPDYTTNAWFAKSSWLKGNRTAVVRLLRAFAMVNKAIHTMSPQKLGAALHSIPGTDWNTTSAADYATQFQELTPFLNPDGGFISKSNWNIALKAFAGWGLSGFDPNNPQFSYLARNDTSYYQQAIGPDPKTG
jgi:ABC-type nitrate/sulfonate/bicarbonate transport system substrate-binding protein